MQAKAIGKTIGSKLLVAVLAIALVFTMMPLCGSVYAEGQTSWNENDVALKIGTTELKRADVKALESIEKTVTVGSEEKTVKGVKLETLFNKYSDYFTKPKVTINTVDIGETPDSKTQLIAEKDAVKDYILAYEEGGKEICVESKIKPGTFGCFNLYDPEDMVSSDGTKLKAVLKMPGEFIAGGSGSGDGSGQGGASEADLVVKYGDKSKNFFFDKAKEQLYYKKSGEKIYIENQPSAGEQLNYSAVNNKGNADSVTGAYGPALLDIFDAAGIDYKGFDKQKVSFAGSDGKDPIELSWGDLFGQKRYYYPNAKDRPSPDIGAAVTDAEMADAVEVPAIINFNADASFQSSFGQISPSERNKPSFCKNLVGKGETVTPEIKIEDETPEPFENAIKPTVESGSEVALGDEIDFTNVPKKGFVYYTTDGSEPTQFSAIYNWNSKDKINAPIKIEEKGVLTIKTKVIGYWNTPSETKTFTYVVPINLAEDGVMTLSKTKVAVGAKPAVKVTANGKTLKVKTDYSLSIGSTKKVGTVKATVTGKGVYKGTLTKSFKVIPAKAKFKSVKPGKKKATILVVSQKSSGVTKYQIAYKLKTAKKWKTTTTKSTKKVIKKLKKGKKYNFKVRAYGKTGYGAYSAVKTVKIK